ncbi:MAG TPA: ABC transporter ATP-binding protein [Acidimicrobiales bacterium]|nr:ABC transporter ATP-binding protein [Acidimicrobiales bacterium]
MSERELVLEGEALNAGFGANHVLHDVDLRVGRGELHGIFGLNGAGKSVLLKVLAGLVPAWSGTVRLDGVDVTGMPTEERVAKGMGHVPQGRMVFADLTVEENLRVGAYTSRRRDRAGYDQRLARVYEQLPVLAEHRDALAGSLSGGQQAALAVGRALVNEPRVLLIDEPSAGLAPIVVEQLFSVLRDVASATGLTMVLVEQNVVFGLRLVDTAHLLQSGRIVYEGPVADLDRDRLAGLLGIGSMLHGTVGSVLESRRPAPPTARKPAAKKKAAAVAKKPAAKKKAAAVAKKPAAKKPATKKPATKKPAVKKATAKKTGAKKPAR